MLHDSNLTNKPQKQTNKQEKKQIRTVDLLDLSFQGNLSTVALCNLLQPNRLKLIVLGGWGGGVVCGGRGGGRLEMVRIWIGDILRKPGCSHR